MSNQHANRSNSLGFTRLGGGRTSCKTRQFDFLCLRAIFNRENCSPIVNGTQHPTHTHGTKSWPAVMRYLHEIPQHRAGKSHVSVIINVHNWVVVRANLIVDIARAQLHVAQCNTSERTLYHRIVCASLCRPSTFLAHKGRCRIHDPHFFRRATNQRAIFSVLIDTVKVQSQRQQHHAKHINCHKMYYTFHQRAFFLLLLRSFCFVLFASSSSFSRETK